MILLSVSMSFIALIISSQPRILLRYTYPLREGLAMLVPAAVCLGMNPAPFTVPWLTKVGTSFLPFMMCRFLIAYSRTLEILGSDGEEDGSET